MIASRHGTNDTNKQLYEHVGKRVSCVSAIISYPLVANWTKCQQGIEKHSDLGEGVRCE